MQIRGCRRGVFRNVGILAADEGPDAGQAEVPADGDHGDDVDG